VILIIVFLNYDIFTISSKVFYHVLFWHLGPVCLLESSFFLESEFQESELFFDV